MNDLVAHPAVLWAAALACAAMALRARRPAPAPGEASPGREPVPRALALAARLGTPESLSGRLTRAGDAADIATAGLEGVIDARRVARARLGAAWMALGVVAPAFLLGPLGVVVAVAAGILGLLAPGRWLARRARRRRQALVRELPDLLDLLGICVESGMALDPALALSADRLAGTVGEEISRVLADLRFGTPRAAAYRGLVDRMRSPELTHAVTALLQADELGAPLSGALSSQAGALRAARRQAARDHAAVAAPKIQLVVALLMVPAVLILVLGVLVIELSRQVGAVMGGG